MKHLRPAIVLIAIFTALTGILLPLAVTGAAMAIVPRRANGSLIERDGKVIGSALLGQEFTAARYFHGRPSATTDTDPKDPTKTIPVPYDANSSGGSNLGPTSKALIDRVKADMAKLGVKGMVPADMVTTSASGLDPDISPADAELQVARVATARKLPEETVRGLVEAHRRGRLLGIFGEPRVDVLALNLALDSLSKR